MQTTITIAELLLSLTIIVIVLLQAKGTSASVFGGSGGSSSYRTRRGLDKTLFNLTIALGVVFLLISLLHPVLVNL